MSDMVSRCDIPEDAIVIQTIDIVMYWTADGVQRFAYSLEGDATSVQIIGLVESIKIQMAIDAVNWGESGDEDDD